MRPGRGAGSPPLYEMTGRKVKQMHHKCDLSVLLLLLLCFPHQRGAIALLTQHQGGRRDLALWAEIYGVPVDEVGRAVGKGRRASLLGLVAAGPAGASCSPPGPGRLLPMPALPLPVLCWGTFSLDGLLLRELSHLCARRASGQRSLIYIFCLP